MDAIQGLSQISFNEAMKLTERQMSVATSNLANADTPGYKARALDFKMALTGAEHSLKVSNPRHIESSHGFSPALKYRDTATARVDGNTVNATVEKAEIKKSSQAYTLAMDTFTGKTKSLSKVLEGK